MVPMHLQNEKNESDSLDVRPKHTKHSEIPSGGRQNSATSQVPRLTKEGSPETHRFDNLDRSCIRVLCHYTSDSESRPLQGLAKNQPVEEAARLRTFGETSELLTHISMADS